MREHIRTWNTDLDGHTVALHLYDLHKRDAMGKHQLGYALWHGGECIFAGEDFAASPMDPVDSDIVMHTLVRLLSLRPGDTDREYFQSYTERQLAWAEQYGDQLALAVEPDHDTYDVEICDDCLHLVANGEVMGPEGENLTDDIAARIDERWGELAPHLVPACENCDEECGFSWSDCDGCGSPLGGTRHRAAVIAPRT